MKKLLSLFFVVALFMLTACSKSSGPFGPSGSSRVTFKSAAIENAVRSQIGIPSGPIYQSDVEGITSLYISGAVIEDPSGIEYLTNLETLSICGSGSDLRDLTPISKLQNLEELYLGQNHNLENIESLANCPKLTFLRLNRCGLTNVKFLHSFRNLTTLEIKANPLESLDGVQGLTKLEEIYFGECDDDTKITDISPLKNLTRLYGIYAGYNDISDLSVLLAMPQMMNGNGDVCFSNNPLNDEAYKVIEILEAHGTDVDY